jgi:hypothetical protein
MLILRYRRASGLAPLTPKQARLIAQRRIIEYLEYILKILIGILYLLMMSLNTKTIYIFNKIKLPYFDIEWLRGKAIKNGFLQSRDYRKIHV